MPDASQNALALRILRAGGVFLAVFVIGCAGYLWLGEGRWSFADAAYMVVITLSTVGYSEVLEGLDTTPGARGFTVLLILGGTGAMLYLTSALTAFIGAILALGLSSSRALASASSPRGAARSRRCASRATSLPSSRWPSTRWCFWCCATRTG